MAAFLLLAGCLGDEAAPTEAASHPAGQEGRPAFAFDCPEGQAAPCPTRLGSLVESYAEPFLAVDPHDPDVLALGTNSMGAPGRLGHVPSAAFQDLVVSTDGGKTWSAATPPAPAPRTPGGIVFTADPSLAFGLDGALHATGVFGERPAPGDPVDDRALLLARGIYHAVSADRGKTWSEPAILARDAGADRNWLTRAPDGTLYLAWFDFVAGAARATWSEDGATWASPIEISGCTFPSEIVFPAEGPALACDEGPVVRLDAAAGTATPLGSPGDGFDVPALAAMSDGTLVVVGRGGEAGLPASRSVDGGATWSAPVDLAASLAHAGNAPSVTRMVMAADGRGALHLVLKLGTGSACERFPNCPFDTLRGPTLLHATLDPATLGLLSETVLARMETPATRTLAPRFQDDMHGAAFAGDVGYLAWAHEGGVDVARLRAA